MRLITRNISSAFKAGKSCSIDNTKTDGKAIWLHGTKIAERREDGMYVQLGSYGYSRTTAERLKPFVNVSRVKGETHLNGKPWDGKWIRV